MSPTQTQIDGTRAARAVEPASARATAAFRRRIAWAGIVFILLIIAADAYEAWGHYQATIARSDRLLAGLSTALAEQTARMIQELDLALADFVSWRRSAAGQTASDVQMRERLLHAIANYPFVHSAGVIGPDGHVRVTTQVAAPANLDLSHQPAFSIHATHASNDLYVGAPSVGRNDGYLTFGLSRRLEDGSGHFAGVVAVRMAFEYLTRFYANVDISPTGSIRLLRDGGVTLAEYPTRATPFGASAQTAGAGNALRTVHRVAGYPLAIEISWPRTSVLQPWVAEERASAWRTGLLALLAVLLLIALMRTLGRRDVADFRRRRLEQRVSELQRAQALGSLAAATAHDFNNVLSAIVGYAELTRSSTAGNSDAQLQLDRLLAAAERARQLIRRVLTFDRHRSVKYVPTDLRAIVSEVIDQVRATLPPCIHLEDARLSVPAWIRGDATEVHQVVMNLCTNAVQAMPAGGQLKVALEALGIGEERSLRQGRLRPGNWLRLAVADTGTGLESSQLQRIFEPFFTTKREGSGTGLGLAVVRNIVLRMGGALDVESRPGFGACFSIYWPQVPPDGDPPMNGPPPLIRPVRALARPGHGETVLVVDDEPELVTLAEDLLAMLGYEPVGFTDARMALAAFRSNAARFDVVITDERMATLRGTALAHAIHGERRDVPIILMTGHHEADLDARATEAGVAEIIEKPLRVQYLEAALNRVLARSSAPASATG
jgi:signal transduction histidine kinase/CheY-like chemotaxis protein